MGAEGRTDKEVHLPTGVREYTETVAVVITTYNDSEFLAEAIRSVLGQDRYADEIIIVDDGSENSPDSIVAEFSGVQLLHKSNGGLSSARNVGLRASRSFYISFLDADDRFEPHAISSGLACFGRHPEAAMVYGGHRRVGVDGQPTGSDHVRPAGEDVYADLLQINFIGMHAAVLYRRDVLLELGGFDEELRMCEDYDVYLRLGRTYSIASHSEVIAEYRRHERNMSRNNNDMLRHVLRVHERHERQERGSRRRAWYVGQRNWNECYRTEPSLFSDDKGWRGAANRMFRRILRSAKWHTKRVFGGGRIHRTIARSTNQWPPAVGDIRFGDLASTTPLSKDYGYERGTPIDRYYIENFLESRSSDVRGRVLEIAENTYSKRFGGSKITHQDVLHLNVRDETTTMIGDLTQPGVMPDNTFDCIILTQTLQMIFNLEDAVTRLHAALKPGGVLLLTVPGISQLERGEWGRAWCWSFTQTSIRKLFGRSFAEDAMDIQTHGNCFAAIAFLFCAGLEEVDRAKLDVLDPTYPVIVTLRAQKR